MKNNYKLLMVIGSLMAFCTVASGLNVMRLTKINQELKNQQKEANFIISNEPYEVDIYAFANKIYNVPTSLLKAIERHETGNYSSELYRTKNNTHGCKQSNGSWCNFDSTDQSTLELARTLAFKYKVQNEYFNLEHISKDYCTTNCDTWVSDVSILIEEENYDED